MQFYFLRSLLSTFISLVLICTFFSVDAFSADIVTLSSRHKYTPDQGSGIAEDARNRSKVVRLVSAADFKSKPIVQQEIAAAPPSEILQKISSRSAYVMDGRSGRVLYSHMPNLPGQPASTIKVITGLIAMESLKNREWVYTSRYAANMPRSKVYLKQGASYRADDLVNAVLLASANDASVALAEKIAGSEKAFAKLMTSKAKALGAQKTICKSANGLTRRGQQSTARDLAIIFDAAMENKEFAKRMVLSKVRTSDGKLLRTHNKALWNVDGAVGGKTGYTRAARQTYVGMFKRDGQELVVAIMGSETMWDDIETLVEYGFSRQQKSEPLRVADDAEGRATRVPMGSHQLKGDGDKALMVLTAQKKTKM